MKKKLLSIMTILASGLAFGQTIPNGGFESWTTLSYEEPTHYQTSNSNNNNGNFYPANAVKTTDAFHANYAIKLSTVLQANSDTSIAYFANGNPGQTPAQGGIPYTQKPTGIRLHYKSNIIGTDSALILVVFKKGGVNLATYFWKIGASQSSYTLFSKTFSPALTVNPDTVIFGATSSDPFNNNYKGTPGNMMQIDSVSFVGASQPATLNGDLEQWQPNSMDLPNGWTSEYAAKTTDAYTGTYAIELQTTAPGFGGGGGIHPGNATSGKYTNYGPPGGGHPYTKQIDTLVFYYKYLPADPNDTAQIYVNFKKNGTNFWNAGTFLLQASVYTRVSIPFDLTMMPSPTVPDSCIITIQSSNKWPAPASYVGSDLKIDNMYFASQTKPVSNFVVPAKGCIGVPIQLMDSSSNMVTSWNWIMGGGTPSSSVSQNPIVTYNTVGTHTIHMNAGNSFGSGPTSSKTITIYALPTVVANAPSVCLGHQATMTASGANTYTWNTGATTATISASPTVTTTYTVTGTDVNGCINTDSEPITILTAPVPDICMVTTDSLSQYNVVYWDKTVYTNVDSFVVYREVQTAPSIYKRIGAQVYDSLSQFIDTARHVGPANGDPNAGSFRYKLQTVDTCGNYSTLSPYHNTIYIAHNSSGVFSWATPYLIEGASSPVQNYYLFCDTNNTNFWKPVANVAGNQQQVVDPTYNNHSSVANWRVDATGFNCNPTLRLNGNNSTYAAKVKSHSNQNNNRMSGIKQLTNANKVSVYPNPATNVLNIGFEASANKVSVKIFSVIGSEILSTSQSSVGNNLSVDISNLASGTYMVQITTDNLVETKKIVKQ